MIADKHNNQQPDNNVEDLLKRARHNFISGQLTLTETICRDILAINPETAVAYHLLGLVAQKLGDNNLAEQQISKSLSIEPDDAKANNNLGNIFKAQGRMEEAVSSYRKALDINPQLVEVHFNIGTALMALEKTAEAAPYFQKAIEIKPDYIEAYHKLGIVSASLGKAEDAEAIYRKIIALNPDDVEAHSNLGSILKAQGRMEEAVNSYRKALSINPESATVHFNLGLCLQAAEKAAEAAPYFQKAIDIKPDYLEVYLNLGAVYAYLGMLEEAAATYRKAIAVKADYVEAHAYLALTIKHTEYDDDIKKMESLYINPGTDSENKIILAFSLGKSFEDFYQYEKAFHYYSSGNKLKRASYTYSIDTDKKFMNTIKETFTGSLFNKHVRSNSTDIQPIFILGMPRSGTTLIEQILASHPNVHGAGELDYIKDTFSKRFKDYEDLRQLNDNHLAEAGNEYLDMLKKHSIDALYITDKMPHNFMFIGLIKLILPQAKIIHCYRDPMDTCLSIYKNNFYNAHYYSNDLKELGQYYNLYRDLMDHWHRSLPGFIFDISYEDMVNDQEVNTRALLDYCGLEWNDACLEFFNSDRVVTTTSFDQVRKPIYRSSMQAWKHYEDQLQPLKKALNQGSSD